MSKLELLFAVFECVFDVLSNIALNLKVALEKRREYKEREDGQTTNENS